MPPQFSPSDRGVVKAETEDRSKIHEVDHCGPGLIAIRRSGCEMLQSWNNLTEKHGWHVAFVEEREAGGIEILMPITEVPGDD